MSRLVREVGLNAPFVAVVPRGADEAADILCLRENADTKEQALFKQYLDSDGKVGWTKVAPDEEPRPTDLAILVGAVPLPGAWQLNPGMGHSF